MERVGDGWGRFRNTLLGPEGSTTGCRLLVRREVAVGVWLLVGLPPSAYLLNIPCVCGGWLWWAWGVGVVSVVC